MDEAMRRLYEKSVPEPVREYLDIVSAPPPRPKRPSRPSQSKATEAKTMPVPTKQEEVGS